MAFGDVVHRRTAALGRSRAYALFGRLYLDGLTEHLWPVIRALPELTATLPDPFDADDAAADHYQLLQLDVLPYASLFLDADARLGGATTCTVQEHYRQAGRSPEPGAESADHLGHELAFLGFLTAAEADALRDGHDDEAKRMRQHQRRFLGSHLLWWLPGVVQALRGRHLFYGTLADLTLDLVLDHHAALGPPPENVRPGPDLPEPPPLLDRPDTGLREIAVYLTTPAWSGLYLSRTDVTRLARSEDLPHGFGGRTLMLTNLLRAAATFNRFEHLVEDMQAIVQRWTHACEALPTTGGPPLPAVARHWRQRLDGTAALLEQLHDEARRHVLRT